MRPTQCVVCHSDSEFQCVSKCTCQGDWPHHKVIESTRARYQNMYFFCVITKNKNARTFFSAFQVFFYSYVWSNTEWLCSRKKFKCYNFWLSFFCLPEMAVKKGMGLWDAKLHKNTINHYVYIHLYIWFVSFRRKYLFVYVLPDINPYT